MLRSVFYIISNYDVTKARANIARPKRAVSLVERVVVCHKTQWAIALSTHRSHLLKGTWKINLLLKGPINLGAMIVGGRVPKKRTHWFCRLLCCSFSLSFPVSFSFVPFSLSLCLFAFLFFLSLSSLSLVPFLFLFLFSFSSLSSPSRFLSVWFLYHFVFLCPFLSPFIFLFVFIFLVFLFLLVFSLLFSLFPSFPSLRKRQRDRRLANPRKSAEGHVREAKPSTAASTCNGPVAETAPNPHRDRYRDRGGLRTRPGALGASFNQLCMACSACNRFIRETQLSWFQYGRSF